MEPKKYSEMILEINDFFDKRVLELRKSLTSQEFLQREEEMNHARRNINNILAIYI